MIICTSLIMFLTLSGVASSAEVTVPARAITGEIVALYDDHERRLMWKPVGINAVYSYSSDGSRVDYVEGSDYAATSNGVVRLSGSTIGNVATYVVTADPGGTFTWVDTPRNPPYTWFLHTYIDYVARVADNEIPALSPSPVTTKVLAAGDSITPGANTVSLDGLGNDDDSYLGLLRTFFNGKFYVENFSEAGTSLNYLTAALPDILANDPPDVVIIAFGMNDHSGGQSNLAGFKSELISDANMIKDAGKRVIFVGFPQKNNMWKNYNETSAVAYNLAIEEAAEATNSAFVDIQAMFERISAFKTHIELFGDNFHHPSNYGQRLYFSGILPHLLSSPVTASEVPDYVTLP